MYPRVASLALRVTQFPGISRLSAASRRRGKYGFACAQDDSSGEFLNNPFFWKDMYDIFATCICKNRQMIVDNCRELCYCVENGSIMLFWRVITMTKEELYYQIQSVRAEISTAKSELKKHEGNLDALEEFEKKCNGKAEDFINSIRSRKNKLSGIASLLDRMKSAMKYHQKMHEALTGVDYNDAKNSIDSLMSTIGELKRNLTQTILDTEDKIEQLNNRLNSLLYEYNHYPEEEEENNG